MMTLDERRPMMTFDRQCGARNRLGQTCRRRPIIGGPVCHSHGGAAPQVRKAARQRLAEMVDQALTELARIAFHGENDAIRLAAIKDILDRAGYKATDHIEHDGKMVIEVVYGSDGY